MRVRSFTTKGEGGVARHDNQFADGGQRIDDIFNDTVAEVSALLGVALPKRQYGNRRAAGLE